MTKENTNKMRSVKELMGMTVKVNEKDVALVKFVTDTQYIDTSVTVADDYTFPKKAVNGRLHPVYYVAKLNVEFAKDVKNVTTGSKEEKLAKNAEIMQNATGFKAVCRDLTNMAGKTEKGFLKMTACLPCDTSINPNGCECSLWVFTSKKLREDWLSSVRNGINSGKYKLHTEKSGKKSSKRIQDIAKAFGITYEEAEAKMKAIKE